LRAEFLMAQAEVSRLAGVLAEAEACMRQALRFYENRQMVLLAEPACALLDSLTEQHSTLKP
jgi:hypothetical protein